MIQEVPIQKVKKNPWQSRKKLDDESIAQLAEEIEELGYWNTPLPARKVGKEFQLVFGHRRLAALKKLQRKTVTLDIEKRTDQQMKCGLAAENFQREDLTEEEALKTWALIDKEFPDNPGQVRKILGLSKQGYARLKKLNEYVAKDKLVRDELKAGNVSAAQVYAAHGLGGEDMVRTAIEKGFKTTTIEQFRARLSTVSNLDQEGVKKRIARGTVKHPEHVKGVAKQVAEQRCRKSFKREEYEEPPAGLETWAGRWTTRFTVIDDQLKEVLEEKESLSYLAQYPYICDEMMAAFKELSETFQQVERGLRKASKSRRFTPASS